MNQLINDQSYTEELLKFIREHRSNEINFEKLYTKLSEAAHHNDAALSERLAPLEQEAEAYRKAKEETGSAWPEFENFVSQFEKQLLHLHQS
jgi:hypothetical protein